VNIDAALAALEATRLAGYIRESLYFFPFLESLHVVGLTMVFGTIAILDLRMLGLASTRRAVGRVATDVETWAWWAFGLTFVTGALMFYGNPLHFYHNIFFRLKIVMLILAGINVWVFHRGIWLSVDRWGVEAATPRAARIAGAAPLAGLAFSRLRNS